MKRNIITFVALAIVVILSVSCNREYKYEPVTYATLYATSFNVNENVGQLKVPVLLNNSTGSDVQVAVKVKEGTAVEDVDYTIVTPANGILTFSGQTDTLDIVIDITNHEGEFTGGTDFKLELTSLTEGVSVIEKCSLVSVKINDLDHPLAPFLGEWTANVMEETNISGEITVVFPIEADPKNLDKVLINFVDPVLSGFGITSDPIVLEGNATLNEDGTGSIVIPAGVSTGIDLGDGELKYYGTDNPSFFASTDYTDFVMYLNSDGKISVPNAFCLLDDKYIYTSLVGGYTLTRK